MRLPFAPPRSKSWLAALIFVLAACGAPALPHPAAPLEATPPAPGPSPSPPPAPAAAAGADSESADAAESPDDSGELEADEAPSPSAGIYPETAPAEHPLDGWSSQRIDRAVASDLASLGSISAGTPNHGALFNGVQATTSELYQPVSPSTAWGTSETIAYLDAAVSVVHRRFADTPPLMLGDIGARHGGPLRPHVSHQAGRDLDISFYYKDGVHWYARGTRDNLDLDRTWAFVRALVTETDVELILIDRGIQALLREHALALGEDPAWLDRIFAEHGSPRPIIRHAKGHATHIHVRFYNPIAQETGRRAYHSLVEHGLLPRVPVYVTHKVKKGETLARIAKKYTTSVRAIREANGLSSNRIRAESVFRIPLPGQSSPPPGRVRIPQRQLPPSPGQAAPLAPRSDAAGPSVSAR